MSETLTSLLIDPADPFIDRDLSWLQFNDRVLSEAEDPTTPLLERLKFLAITAGNLDEFFMIRFSSLDKKLNLLSREDGVAADRLERMLKIRSLLLSLVQTFFTRQTKALELILKEVDKRGFLCERQFQNDPVELEAAKKVFEERVVPLLTAPLPITEESLRALLNLEMGVTISERSFLRLPRDVPTQFVESLPDGRRHLFFIDDLLTQFAAAHFGETGPVCCLRVTRDADVSVELSSTDSESIPTQVRQRLSTRDSGKIVRLQVRGTTLPENLALPKLAEIYRIDSAQIFKVSAPLSLAGLMSFVESERANRTETEDLLYPPLKAMVPVALQKGAPIFENLKDQDYLLHHPYDSFDAYVNFIEAAVTDPAVESIQQTIYRADALSEVIQLLKKATRTKRIRILIEPRARFDEMNNVRLAEEFSKAGATVVFASGKLKLHAKIALVERRENGQLVRYTHLATGNYNAKTAKQYVDLAILTAHEEIGEDAHNFFEQVCRGQLPTKLKHLILAPSGLHKKMTQLIEEERQAALDGKPARIFAKVNALVDEDIVRSLYRASQAGVKVDMIVRGACSIIPSVQGTSENIRVTSIVDRFLEHSRIYYFQNANQLFLSSADWMPRNFFSRLEIAFPLLHPKIIEFMSQWVIPIYLRDRMKTHLLTKLGTWRHIRKAGEESKLPRAQEEFAKLAEQQYEGTPLIEEARYHSARS